MAATLIQLCSEAASQADRCIAQIAELAGLRVSQAKEPDEALVELRARKREENAPVVVAVSGDTFARFGASADTVRHGAMEEIRSLANFFVYGASGSEDVLLRRLSVSMPTATLGPSAAEPVKYEFKTAAGAPLAGLSFTVAGTRAVKVFTESGQLEGSKVLLTVNGQAALIARRHGSADDYFLSQAPEVSLDAKVTPTQLPNDYQGEILPAALALKQMFGEFCWHNPYPVACFVIDDIWLQKRYGFFNYDQVLAELAAGDYTTTIAFIPSNYRRNDPRVVSQVAGSKDHFSLCVHGCDHTRGEFGETDEKSIESKAAIALDKMEKLRDLTALNFDSVMVFPQGVYSSCSALALKHCGYLAAANTVPYPTDHAAAPVSLRDVFDLAITCYGSFPIFTRHYPRRTFDFAVALFWGKPVLLVEHHEYYQNGLGHVTEFVKELRKLDARLDWLTLEKALVQSGHYQLVSANNYAVKFVTATFQVRNPSAEPAHFTCRKPESEPDRIAAVWLDQEPVTHGLEAGFVRVELDLQPGEQRVITIKYQPYPARRIERSFNYRFKAALRRRLSEIRDNHLSRSDRVLGLAKSVKRWLRV